VGDVGPARRRAAPFDRRASGSAAIECAFVAAGVLDGARFRRLWIWDVAAGVALARAAGVPVWVGTRRGWTPFARFVAPPTRAAGRRSTLRDWHRPLLLGPLETAGRSV
jgi:myo-inositol-1(or 4)-monophosphatase